MIAADSTKTQRLILYSGRAIEVVALGNGIVELRFDRVASQKNTLDRLAITELASAVEVIIATPGVTGILMASAKDSFVVGADVEELLQMLALSDDELAVVFERANQVFNAIEQLPAPVVAAINGDALGGGLELALAADLRIASATAKLGFPEVNLGILPGLGGIVRMPRIAGEEAALDWIAGGHAMDAAAAHALGVIDKVVSDEDLRLGAVALLTSAAAGQIDWQSRRNLKRGPVRQPISQRISATTARLEKLALRTHQGAALAAAHLIEKSVFESRDVTLKRQAAEFLRVAKSQAANSLVQIRASEQAMQRSAKEHVASAQQVSRAAVLGAGIMGGGIAFASAVRGVPVLLKDIKPEPLKLGIGEARRLLQKQVESGRMDHASASAVISSITPQLEFRGFDRVDAVIEAVVENLTVKHAVLRDVEARTRSGALIASNTSSLRIDDLARVLQRPENFVGMHFFNPAPVMPLVEVIRGSKTSPLAVATAAAYVVSMGKTPIVVKDGPGFLVNRVLTPFMLAFLDLVRMGVDFVAIDRALEEFGLPMGPAYLNDVIGMDTALHVLQTITAGFPDRMRRDGSADAVGVMVKHGRFGQKNGAGFYRYSMDQAGKVVKQLDTQVQGILSEIQVNDRNRAMPPVEVVDRLMLAMVVEAAWCLEEDVVETPQELDMALLLGLGLPRYLGGVLKYADWLGLDKVVQRCDGYATTATYYKVPAGLRSRAAKRERYFGPNGH